MRRFPVIFLLLLSSIGAFACGFYPFGDQLRFCFLYPQRSGFDGYHSFFYGYLNFYDFDHGVPTVEGPGPNVLAWKAYCNGKVPAEAIEEAVYAISPDSLSKGSPNAMVRYLFASKDREAIEYLKFAKKTENLSSFSEDDFWEKAEQKLQVEGYQYMNKALWRARHLKNPWLAERYRFLAVRIAMYNGNAGMTRKIYADNFAAHEARTLADFWALHYYASLEPDPAKANFYHARVFANAPDKRFASIQAFHRGIDIKRVLAFAETGRDSAAVQLLYAVRKTGPALESLRAMYDSDTASEGLAFLLLREVNKCEDWIFTPYYSRFLPILRTDEWENSNNTRVMQRVEIDREYAAALLGFVEKADLSKVNRPEVWQVSKAYLLFMAKRYAEAETELRKLEKLLGPKNEFSDRIAVIKALCLTANQPYGKAVIPSEVKPILIAQATKTNAKFVFAVARELENLGNTTDAALLFAKMDKIQEVDDQYYEWDRQVSWLSKNHSHTLQQNFYSDAYGYLDAAYTPVQMEALIASVPNRPRDAFSDWLYGEFASDPSVFYDLLGMKYMRRDQPDKAWAAFSKVSRKYGSHDVFYTNPFFQLRNTPAFFDYPKTRITKATIARQLTDYLQKADDLKNPKRYLYCFYVANCYRNMAYGGSAMEMRRLFVSTNQSDGKFEDETEFYQARLARKYYRMAMDASGKPKFKALCLRLLHSAAEVEKDFKTGRLPWRLQTRRAVPNPYDGELRRRYPQYADDLSFCAFFPAYFEAR